MLYSGKFYFSQEKASVEKEELKNWERSVPVLMKYDFSAVFLSFNTVFSKA